MTRKDLKNNILNHRMNFLINYYITTLNNNSIKKYKLIEYYTRSYKDNYLMNNLKKRNEMNGNEMNGNEMNDYIEKRDDDVEDHYKYMFINPPPKPEIDYDELDRQYLIKLELEEQEKYDMENYDDYDDYEDDNYEDDYEELDNEYDYNDDEYIYEY
jgi:hypothetical protein